MPSLHRRITKSPTRRHNHARFDDGIVLENSKIRYFSSIFVHHVILVNSILTFFFHSLVFFTKTHGKLYIFQILQHIFLCVPIDTLQKSVFWYEKSVKIIDSQVTTLTKFQRQKWLWKTKRNEMDRYNQITCSPIEMRRIVVAHATIRIHSIHTFTNLTFFKIIHIFSVFFALLWLDSTWFSQWIGSRLASQRRKPSVSYSNTNVFFSFHFFSRWRFLILCVPPLFWLLLLLCCKSV